MEIVGRLTEDAKVETTPKNEKQVVNFSIAINDSYKPRDSEEYAKVTTYVNCSYWINPGIAQYLTKGTLVELYGRIGVSAWNSAQGEARASLTFHVNTIKLHGKPKAASNAPVISMGSNKSNQPMNAGDITEPLDDLPF